MKKVKSIFISPLLFSFIFMFSLISCKNEVSNQSKESKEKNSSAPLTIIIHGGAGEIKPGFLTSEEEEEYRSKLKEALNTGFKIIETGGKSIDAVVATLKIMEDSPLFNAAKGSVLTHKGLVSMDASIMNGLNLNAGAVSGLMHVKNPIELALLVMDSSKHVFLSGAGAEEFATHFQLETRDNYYFITPKRQNQLKRVLGQDSIHITHNELELGDKYGTVGCVAIDAEGNIAAGTSTGGMVNKQWGRIGDAPIIGAGTYADNQSCGISATGHGEYFIRLGVAKEISNLIKYGNLSLDEACKEVIQNQLNDLGGTGGVIAIDNKGNYHFEFNTPGMYRGVKTQEIEEVKFYKN